jgi:hypothetical protein
MTHSAAAHLLSDQDPTCSVSGCSRPHGGTLTLANRGGGFRVSACDEHGWRAAQGEWFVFEVMGRKYAFGGGETPPHYSPLRADLGIESLVRSRRRQHLAALRLYDPSR